MEQIHTKLLIFFASTSFNLDYQVTSIWVD